jgi:hypothetical protein
MKGRIWNSGIFLNYGGVNIEGIGVGFAMLCVLCMNIKDSFTGKAKWIYSL